MNTVTPSRKDVLTGDPDMHDLWRFTNKTRCNLQTVTMFGTVHDEDASRFVMFKNLLTGSLNFLTSGKNTYTVQFCEFFPK